MCQVLGFTDVMARNLFGGEEPSAVGAMRAVFASLDSKRVIEILK
jgi:hypothetical protein